MTDEPFGYDLSYSQNASDDLRRLSPQHRAGAQHMIESLLRDPTAANPSVFEIIGGEGYAAGDHVMLWRDIAITFRFLNPLVIELLAVDIGLRFSTADLI